MKTLVFVVICLTTDVALSATYSWKNVSVINGSGPGDLRWYAFGGVVYSGNDYVASTEGPLVGYKGGNAFYMRQQDHGTTQMEMDNNMWIVAYYGELLNADAFVAADCIPLSNWYDETASNGRFVSDKNDFYLAFMTIGTNVKDDIERYGWFHVALNDELEMSILDSGIGLYGESVYVGGGAVPEPNSGILYLFGFLTLMVRRSHRLKFVRPTNERSAML